MIPFRASISIQFQWAQNLPLIACALICWIVQRPVIRFTSKLKWILWRISAGYIWIYLERPPIFRQKCMHDMLQRHHCGGTWNDLMSAPAKCKFPKNQKLFKLMDHDSGQWVYRLTQIRCTRTSFSRFKMKWSLIIKSLSGTTDRVSYFCSKFRWLIDDGVGCDDVAIQQNHRTVCR